MADSKISALTDGSPLQATDKLVAARAGTDVALPGTAFLTKLFDSTLGANAASIDTGAGGIPAGYGTLEIIFAGRTAHATVFGQLLFTFNNDTGANYDAMENEATWNGSSFVNTNGRTTGATSFGRCFVAGNGAPANFAGMAIIRVPFPGSTTFYKTFTASSGRVDSGTGGGDSDHIMGTWRSTAAISRVAVAGGSSTNLLAGSRMLIYGLPG